MTHADRCDCPVCRAMAKRWPGDGPQLRLIEAGEPQLAPTDAEAARRLFELAGLRFPLARQGGFDL